MYGDFDFHVFGTCTSDPEYSTLANGTKRASINIAVNTPRKQQDGSYTEMHTFVRLAFFGQQAERQTISWCKKGTPVYCRGTVSSYQQETSEGKKLTMYNFRPDVLRPVGSGRRDQPEQGAQAPAPQSQGAAPDAGPDVNYDDFPEAFS